MDAASFQQTAELPKYAPRPRTHQSGTGSLRTSPGKGNQASFSYLAETPSKPYLDGPPDTTMGEEAIACSGLGAPHQNIGPRLAMNFCIARWTCLDTEVPLSQVR
jgi:microcystin-dependent protein